MALTKRDESKIGTFAYHEPKPAELFEPNQIGAISIFQYGVNKAGDALKRIGTTYKIRFERCVTDQAIKKAKQVVKELNAGTLDVDSPVICIPTGRPRGRQKAAV